MCFQKKFLEFRGSAAVPAHRFASSLLRFFAWSEGPQSLMLCFVTLIAIQNTLIRFIGNSARSTRFIGTIWLPGAGSVPESSEFPVFFPDTRETRPRDRFAADCLLRQLVKPSRSHRNSVSGNPIFRARSALLARQPKSQTDDRHRELARWAIFSPDASFPLRFIRASASVRDSQTSLIRRVA